MSASPRLYGSSAKAYLAAGYWPLPLPPRKKANPPGGYTGRDGRQVELADVERWITEHRSGNIGIRLPRGVAGVDVDAYKDAEHLAAWEELTSRCGPLPDAPWCTSRDDGVSGVRLFRVPEDWEAAGKLPEGSNGVSPGEVIQWHHRYAVCPPSIHPDTGRAYRWRTGTITKVADLPELPESWLEALSAAIAPPAPSRPSPASRNGDHAGIRPGDDFNERADWLTDILGPHGWQLSHETGGTLYVTRPGKSAREGHSATIGHSKDGVDRLYVFSADAAPFEMEKPYSKFNAYALLNHNGNHRAAARELGRAGYGTPPRPATARGDRDQQPPGAEGKNVGHLAARIGRGDFRPVSQAEAGRAELPPDLSGGELPSAEEKAFWDAAPGLTAVRDWARARRAGPYALLGEVLLQVAARIPPQVVLPPLGIVADGQTQGSASLNQLYASVGPSGLSKGLGHQLAHEIVKWRDDTPAPVYAPLGSGEGIAATYAACQRDENKNWVMVRLAWSAVFAATEIDRMAALLSRRNATLGGVLRSAWSGEPLGEANATEDRRRHVPRYGYRAGITVHVQPGRGGALLGADETAAGTPQRVLWLPAADPDIPDTAPPAPPMLTWQPPDQVSIAVADLEAQGLDRLGELDLVVVPVCQEARDAIDRAAVARHRGEADALDGHVLLVQEKLAAVLGAFLGRFGVTDEDWQLAGHLMLVSARTREAVVRALRQADEQRNEAMGRAEARRAQIVSETAERNILQSTESRVMAVLRKAGKGAWVAHAALRRQLSSPQRDSLPEVIDRLVQEELIAIRGTTAGHGDAGVEYGIPSR